MVNAAMEEMKYREWEDAMRMTTLIVAFSLMLGTALAQDSTLNVAGSVSYTGNIQINKGDTVLREPVT